VSSTAHYYFTPTTTPTLSCRGDCFIRVVPAVAISVPDVVNTEPQVAEGSTDRVSAAQKWCGDRNACVRSTAHSIFQKVRTWSGLPRSPGGGSRLLARKPSHQLLPELGLRTSQGLYRCRFGERTAQDAAVSATRPSARVTINKRIALLGRTDRGRRGRGSRAKAPRTSPKADAGAPGYDFVCQRDRWTPLPAPKTIGYPSSRHHTKLTGRDRPPRRAGRFTPLRLCKRARRAFRSFWTSGHRLAGRSARLWARHRSWDACDLSRRWRRLARVRAGHGLCAKEGQYVDGDAGAGRVGGDGRILAVTFNNRHR